MSWPHVNHRARRAAEAMRHVLLMSEQPVSFLPGQPPFTQFRMAHLASTPLARRRCPHGLWWSRCRFQWRDGTCASCWLRAKPATSKIRFLRRIANPGQPDANCEILEMKSHRTYDSCHVAAARKFGDQSGFQAAEHLADRSWRLQVIVRRQCTKWRFFRSLGRAPRP